MERRGHERRRGIEPRYVLLTRCVAQFAYSQLTNLNSLPFPIPFITIYCLHDIESEASLLGTPPLTFSALRILQLSLSKWRGRHCVQTSSFACAVVFPMLRVANQLFCLDYSQMTASVSLSYFFPFIRRILPGAQEYHACSIPVYRNYESKLGPLAFPPDNDLARCIVYVGQDRDSVSQSAIQPAFRNTLSKSSHGSVNSMLPVCAVWKSRILWLETQWQQGLILSLYACHIDSLDSGVWRQHPEIIGLPWFPIMFRCHIYWIHRWHNLSDI